MTKRFISATYNTSKLLFDSKLLPLLTAFFSLQRWEDWSEQIRLWTSFIFLCSTTFSWASLSVSTTENWNVRKHIKSSLLIRECHTLTHFPGLMNTWSWSFLHWNRPIRQGLTIVPWNQTCFSKSRASVVWLVRDWIWIKSDFLGQPDLLNVSTWKQARTKGAKFSSITKDGTVEQMLVSLNSTI